MLLFHSIFTFMKDLYQSENQVFNPTLLGGERVGRLTPSALLCCVEGGRVIIQLFQNDIQFDLTAQ